MAPDRIFQVSDILIHPYFIGKNIICTIRQALTTFNKPGTYVEQATLLILLRKVWYQIYESRILE